jgi:hypothetical protein
VTNENPPDSRPQALIDFDRMTRARWRHSALEWHDLADRLAFLSSRTISEEGIVDIDAKTREARANTQLADLRFVHNPRPRKETP